MIVRALQRPLALLRTARDLIVARRAKRAGATNSLRIVYEAHRAQVRVSDAFELVDAESGFRNIFGADEHAPFAHLKVTADRVAALIRSVIAGGVSNGVGLTQLTYLPYILAAQQLGGAHVPRNQLRVGIGLLGSLQRAHGGRRAGFRAYNGSGPAAEAYAEARLAGALKWHNRLK